MIHQMCVGGCRYCTVYHKGNAPFQNFEKVRVCNCHKLTFRNQVQSLADFCRLCSSSQSWLDWGIQGINQSRLAHWGLGAQGLIFENSLYQDLGFYAPRPKKGSNFIVRVLMPPVLGISNGKSPDGLDVKVAKHERNLARQKPRCCQPVSAAVLVESVSVVTRVEKDLACA